MVTAVVVETVAMSGVVLRKEREDANPRAIRIVSVFRLRAG